MKQILFGCILVVSTIFQSNKLQGSQADINRTEELIQQSYITPELQWSILNYMDHQAQIILDLTTGMPYKKYSSNEILTQIAQDLQLPMRNEKKERMKHALHAMMEATHIANFRASLQAAYQSTPVHTTLNLTEIFQQKQQHIQACLDRVNRISTSDEAPSNTSYVSWFFSPTSNQQLPQSTDVKQVYINRQTQTATISPETMEGIVQKNDYKRQDSAAAGAVLLFKACFIAQPERLTQDVPHFPDLAIKIPANINQYTYIFDEYNSFDDIVAQATNHVHNVAERTKETDPLTDEHNQAHTLLLHTRQAVDTALYIANKNSSYNIGYAILPVSITKTINSYLDGIVAELMKYEAKLSELCTDPKYGATELDLKKSDEWSTISKVAAGLIVTGAVVGAIHVVNPTVISSVSSYLPSVTGWLPSWGSTATTPVQTPIQNPMPAQQAQENSSTWAQWTGKQLQTVGKIATYGATIGSGAELIGKNMTDASGIMTEEGKLLQSYGQQIGVAGRIGGALTGQLGDVANAVSTTSSLAGGNIGTAGAAASSGIRAIDAANKAYNAKGFDMTKNFTAIQSAKDALTKTTTAYKTITTNPTELEAPAASKEAAKAQETTMYNQLKNVCSNIIQQYKQTPAKIATELKDIGQIIVRDGVIPKDKLYQFFMNELLPEYPTDYAIAGAITLAAQQIQQLNVTTSAT